MTESEFLERIDGHIAVANAHLECGNTIMERVEDEVRLNRAERQETRIFMRELTLRHERVTQRMVNQLSDQSAILRDLHDEHVAFRKVLFRVNDRLEDLRPEDLG